MDLLSYPFRVAANGSVETVEDGTEAALREQVAVHALTRRGERALVPGFGVSDPVFSDLDVAELNASLAIFGPPVRVSIAAREYPTASTERVTLAISSGASDAQA